MKTESEIACLPSAQMGPRRALDRMDRKVDWSFQTSALSGHRAVAWLAFAAWVDLGCPRDAVALEERAVRGMVGGKDQDQPSGHWDLGHRSCPRVHHIPAL